MKRIYVFLFALFIFSTYVFAAPISESEAREKAAKFMLSKKGESSARSVRRFGGSVGGNKLTAAESREAFYVFNIDSDGGYVIVSGDDRMPDVLGYSYSSTYKSEEIPDNMRAWLEGYAEQYEYLQTHSDAKGASLTTVTGSSISPMLTCHWSQGSPYNDKCPTINGETTVTGCVATAMAQIMYYHQWPKQTAKEIPAYTTTTRGISMPAIGITSIDWDNMRSEYYSNYTEAQKNAISTLMLLCGCAVKMDYDSDASGAYSVNVRSAYVNYFGFSDSEVSYVTRSSYSDAAWNQMIYLELNNERPVYYSGNGSEGGHAFVIDGYDSDDYFHVNWGWGGYQDDYFLLSALKDYNNNQGAVIGIKGQSDVEHKYAYAELKGSTLTFYYDLDRESHSGPLFCNMNSHEWSSDNYKGAIKTIKFDPSFGEYNMLSSAFYMFYNLKNLTSIQGLEYLNTQNVTDMTGMFAYCTSLTSLDVSSFNTQNVADMQYMFSDCSSLTSLDVSSFDTKKVTNMEHMFSGCTSLTSLDVSSFNTQNVTNMCGMFSECYGLTNIDLSRFNMQNVTNTSYMFYNCSNLKSATIGKGITSIGNYAFSGCSSLTSVTIPKNVKSVGESAFENCPRLKDVYCYAEKAPATGSNVFASSPISNATLNVPKASLESYKATAPWSEFGAIKSMDVEYIYIETDVTSQFPTDWKGWSGTTGYTSTQFAPMVTTNDGRTVQVCEKFNNSSAELGTVFKRTLSGLTNGTYRIELYGAASSTKGRDTSISSDMTASDEGDETAVYLYAKTVSGTVKQYIPVHWATSFSEVATAVLNGVDVTNGTVEIGMYSDKRYTNWHVVQIKGVTALVDAEELYDNVLQEAQATLADAEYANVVGQERTALAQAVRQYSTISEKTSDAYQTAINALESATKTFTDAKGSYDEWAHIKNLSYPYASAEKKAAAESAAAVNPINAADAASKTESMLPLFRIYAESSALLEGVKGATDMTSYIKNPKAESAIVSSEWQIVLGSGSGGRIGILNDQPWTDGSGSSVHSYFDGGNWGAVAWDVSLVQNVTLPAGRYQLTVLGRSSTDVEQTLLAGNNSMKMPNINDVGGLFNKGWEQTSVEFELASEESVKIGVRGVTDVIHNWMSFSDFRLVRFPDIKKCATPTINFANGKLQFSCETEGVEYVYEVKCADAAKGSGETVTLTQKYIISVYATKSGYENSDVATKEIIVGGIDGLRGDLNGDGTVGMPDAMFIVNKMLKGKFPDEE